jgi:hypothetical protein
MVKILSNLSKPIRRPFKGYERFEETDPSIEYETLSPGLLKLSKGL